MDSTTIEGADLNPYGKYVADYASFKKNYHATEYRAMGKYRWIEISEHTRAGIKKAMVEF